MFVDFLTAIHMYFLLCLLLIGEYLIKFEDMVMSLLNMCLYMAFVN